MSLPEYNLTLQLLPTGRYKLLDGLPVDHGLKSTAAHAFDMPHGTTIFWTVDCDLTGEQVRAIAIGLLGQL